MDLRSIRFDWNRARAFLVTAQEGSLSAAARVLGLTQPTLGRQVDALQRELGVVLFERSGRGLELTPAGFDLLDHVRAMGEAAERVSLTASGHSQTIAGTVRISAGEAYSAYLLVPLIVELRSIHPAIRVEVEATSRISDLKRREADIAIRNVRPEGNDLVGRLLRMAAGQFYATPAYLASIGNPVRPEDFSKASFVSFGDADAMAALMAARGLPVTLANFAVACESHLVQWETVKRGGGIGVMDQQIGDAEPMVTRAIPGFDPVEFPVWLVAHREVNTSRRIRLVFDFLAEALTRDLPAA